MRACVARDAAVRDRLPGAGLGVLRRAAGQLAPLRRLRALPGLELRAFGLRWASANHWSRRFAGRLNLLTDDDRDYVIGA